MASATEQSSPSMGDSEESVGNEVNELIEVDEEDDEQSEEDEMAEADDEDDQQSEEDEGGQQEKQETKKRKAIALSFDIWDHFAKVKTANGEEKTRHNYCGNLYRRDTKTDGKNQLQPSQGNSSAGSLSTSPSTSEFDLDELRNCFAEMIIEDEQPFALSEFPGLRKFLAIACPQFTLPSRREATIACLEVYDVQKEKLKNVLKEHCGRVSLTTDTWTANTDQNYMSVTAHFIDNDWKLQKKIIGFLLVKGHRGEEIGESLQNCLAAWGMNKVSTITVDNASANNNAIKYMQRVLNESNGSIAKGEYLHMRCVAHIVKLMVSEGLKEIDRSVVRVRAAVRFVKGETSRLARFKKCAELAKVQTKAFLTLDVCTKWNSTYLMLNTAQQYEKAFERYSDEDPYYKLELNDEKDGPGVPEKSDWDNARKMAEFLEYFYELTLRISVTSHPTSNIYFHEIADLLLFLQEWRDSEDKLFSEMGKRMLVKYYKYFGFGEKYEERMGDREKPGEKDKGGQLLNFVVFFCVAIDPRYKLSTYIKIIMIIFGDEIGEKLWETVNTSFRALFEEYRNMYAPSDNAPQQPTETQEPPPKRKRLMKAIIALKMSKNGGANATTKSELDKYFSEDNEEDYKGFDILNYWKNKAKKFPILSRMARDLLAIPISTVPSESAFSTGGRVLDDFRSSLTPTMVERLICARDWIRGSDVVSVEENEEELYKLEEELCAHIIPKETSES